MKKKICNKLFISHHSVEIQHESLNSSDDVIELRCATFNLCHDKANHQCLEHIKCLSGVDTNVLKVTHIKVLSTNDIKTITYVMMTQINYVYNVTHTSKMPTYNMQMLTHGTRKLILDM